ncbi:hypothetical protein [Kocuria sp.]|nr:hypothetical protein [Kocuria sp.]MDO4919941.1 hypothetical protein [Kocuria sp.]
MPRFEDTFTGVIVEVSEERAAELPDRFVPVRPAREKPTAKK